MDCSKIVVAAAVLWVLGGGTSPVDGAVKLADVFKRHMVLQRDIKVPVWGTAAVGQEVRVELNGRKASTRADAKGNWKLALDPMPAGGPYKMVVTGERRIVLTDVLIGEVWLCSGQSNMQVTVKHSVNGAEEVKKADDPMIRLCVVRPNSTPEPQTSARLSWRVCSPQTVGGFSGVAYFFGRELRKALKVPVGLIKSSVSGTPAEAWMSWEALRADPDFQPIIDHYRKSLAGFPPKKAAYDKAYGEWRKAWKAARAEGKKGPRPPWPPFGPGHKQAPAGLYNGSILPLAPYALRGVIWYQGENNADRSYQYRKLFPALIADWRQVWGQGDFPFLFVQLAPYSRYGKSSSLPELQEAQLLTWKTAPNTGMAVTIDLGEEKDVHPKNKQDVGLRLGLLARALVYGEKIVCSGPIYDAMRIEGDRVRLSFKRVGGGLTAKGGELQGFTIAGADKKFVPAKAEIDGREVAVSSAAVKAPVAVRYAWASFPRCNLYNKEGLPASPFRTDDWPAMTRDKKEPRF